MENHNIRRLGGSDFAIARQAVVEVHGRAITSDAALAIFLTDPACVLIVAMEGGRVVGSLTGHSLRHPHRAGPRFLLYEIDVRPECRNRRIRRALVTAFAAEARGAGAFEQWVLTNESNSAARALYQSCGYRRPNSDDVLLQRGIS